MDDVAEPQSRRALVATLTLGCKLNQAESQSIARTLEAAGYATIDRPAPANAYVINTCSVTHVADRKARHLIRMAKRLSPGAPVVVTGCYAERARDEILAETGADVVLGNAEKGSAATTVMRLLEAKGSGSEPAAEATEEEGAQGRRGRTRAFLKIQEGCDDVCAFCIVPRVRGRERAVAIEEVVRSAQERERAGVLEVVLTGTQPGAYGRDREDGTSAARLIAALLAETSLPRIRYSSIQPQDVSASFLAQWQDGRMCRHFHLALQSGSDAVLRRMRRRYDVAAFVAAVERIRAAVPGAAITTDVIAGFPGETEEDFEATLAVCRSVGFAAIHAFPYSARPGTGAAQMADDVEAATKRERVRMLRALGDEGACAYRTSMLGGVEAVLFESWKAQGGGDEDDAGEGYWSGLTDTYVPVRVRAESAQGDLRNRLVAVRLESIEAGAVLGRVLR